MVAAATWGLTACGGGGPEPQPAPPTQPPPQQSHSATPEPSPTGSTATPGSRTEKSTREVLALVKKYFAVDEAVATDQTTPLKRYNEVAAGDYATELQRGAQAMRAKGYRVKGKTRPSTPELKDLNLAPAKRKPATARVAVCVDVRDVDVVDKRGKSVVSATRADAYNEVLRLERKSYGWRVVDASDTEASTCDA